MSGDAAVRLERAEILGHRRRVSALDERLEPGAASFRRAAIAGLSDSMPRGALLSLHARVRGVGPEAWEDPAFVQVWGPRFSAYVVGADDRAPFTLGRLPDEGPQRRRAIETADRLETFLAGRRMSYADAGKAMGLDDANTLRYATTTGRVLIRWEGARRPIVWTVPAPEVDPFEARLELLRRYLHVIGPGTEDGFADWAGIKPARTAAAFEALRPELVRTRSPVGDGWILASDEASFRRRPGASTGARLLPSGDTLYLLQGVQRELLVPDPLRRAELWTTRVWPGALLLDGEVAGTWRRAGGNVAIATWRPLGAAERATVEAEAASLPLPDLTGPIRVAWDA